MIILYVITAVLLLLIVLSMFRAKNIEEVFLLIFAWCLASLLAFLIAVGIVIILLGIGVLP